MPGLQSHNQTDLFQSALGLKQPWQVSDVVFSHEEGRLDIYLRFAKGARFTCPDCGNPAPVHDTVERTWRHLNFFQYEAYIHARVPRTDCPGCRKTLTVPVPWARPNSGFTLLFEAFAMELARSIPLATAGNIVNERDKRLMRIVEHYVSRAREKTDMSRAKVVGMDETSRAKGHDYITVFIDAPRSQVLYAAPGKDSSTVKRFIEDLKRHNGSPDAIKQACADLSPAYKKGISEYLPRAEVVFDRFHVMKMVNDALDRTRRQEQKEKGVLKGSRYAWLHNPETATPKQSEQLKKLTRLNLKTARAYRIRLALRDIYDLSDRCQAEAALKKWYFWATHSRIDPIIKAAKTIKQHWDGVMAFFSGRVSNGTIEGINSVIQTIKRQGKGYPNTDNFITLIYLRCAKLEFGLPRVCGFAHYR